MRRCFLIIVCRCSWVHPDAFVRSKSEIRENFISYPATLVFSFLEIVAILLLSSRQEPDRDQRIFVRLFLGCEIVFYEHVSYVLLFVKLAVVSALFQL